MSDAIEKPYGFSFWISTIFMIGCFLIFVFLLCRYYIDGREGASVVPTLLTAEERAEAGIATPEERVARLQELRAASANAATTYGWIDQGNGVVRLPIDRAMELVVQEHQTASEMP